MAIRPPGHNSISESVSSLVNAYATQLTAALSLIVGVSGAMMFFHLAKSRVQSLHEWLGITFLLAAVLHALRNRRAISSMLAQKRMRLLLGITALVAAAFLALAPAAKTNPAKGLAQALQRSPISLVAPALGISSELALSRLKTMVGIDAKATDSIDGIAAANNVDASHLLSALMGELRKN